MVELERRLIYTINSEFTDYEYYGGATRLPTFRGYTVDTHLKEFRRAEYGKGIEFIEFDSPEGDELLVELIEIVPHDGRLFYELLMAVGT